MIYHIIFIFTISLPITIPFILFIVNHKHKIKLLKTSQGLLITQILFTAYARESLKLKSSFSNIYTCTVYVNKHNLYINILINKKIEIYPLTIHSLELLKSSVIRDHSSYLESFFNNKKYYLSPSNSLLIFGEKKYLDSSISKLKKYIQKQ